MDQRCYNINNFFIIVRDPHSFLLVVFFSFLCVFMTWMLYLPTVESMNIIVCNFCILSARNYSHFFGIKYVFFRAFFDFTFFHNFSIHKSTTTFSTSAKGKKSFRYEFYHFFLFLHFVFVSYINEIL